MSCASASRRSKRSSAPACDGRSGALADQGSPPPDGDRDGFEREGWQKLNQELGLTAIHIPEAYGGQGFGHAEASHRAGGDGPRILCAPFFSTVLATTAILNAGTEEQKRALLPAIAVGREDRDLGLLRG